MQHTNCVHRDDLRHNLNSSNKRCTVVYKILIVNKTTQSQIDCSKIAHNVVSAHIWSYDSTPGQNLDSGRFILATAVIGKMWLHTNVNDVRWSMKIRSDTMTTECRYYLITITFSSLSATQIVAAAISSVLEMQRQQKRPQLTTGHTTN